MDDRTAGRNQFAELVNWFVRHSNGDWEHGDGITIETLDNPGWRVRINLEDTELEGQAFERRRVERSEDDWVHAWVEEKSFNLSCGPLNIEEAIGIFVAWSLAGTGEREFD